MDFWLNVPNYEGYVCDPWAGKIRSPYGRILTARFNSTTGYFIVYLRRNGKQVTTNFHRVLLSTYLGWEPTVARHLDDDRQNNSLFNLAAGTNGQNQRDSVTNGTHVSFQQMKRVTRLSDGKTWESYSALRKEIGASSRLSDCINSGKPYRDELYVYESDYCHNKRHKVRCVELNQVFASRGEAARFAGVNSPTISRAIKRGYKAGGYHWENASLFD